MIEQKIFKAEEEWLKFRENYFTSSELNRLLTEPTKAQKAAGKLLSDGAMTYIYEKVAAQLGVSEPIYYSPEMQHGKDTEKFAAARLCDDFKYDAESKEVLYANAGGFIIYSDGKLAGTPDLILPTAIAEIKCPKASNHLRYKTYDAVSFKENLPNYYAQVQSNMYLADRNECIFMSYDYRFERTDLQAHYIIIDRDDEFIEAMLKKVEIAFDYMNKLKLTL
jgi:hypothetical protein